MQHLEDGTIHAWLDGALGAADAERVEEHVGTCRACADRVAEARGLIAASSRILMALDHVPADVVPAARVASHAVAAASPAPAAVTAAPRARWGLRYGRWAAVMAFVLAGTFVLTREANRRDVAVSREKARPTDELETSRDSGAVASTAPVAARAAAPVAAQKTAPKQRAAAPPAALGGALPQSAAAPALKAETMSLAARSRQDAVAGGLAGRAGIRVFDKAKKTADSSANALQAQPSSTLVAKRRDTAARDRPVELQEEVVTGQGHAQSAVPRLVAVDSAQRGAAMVRRETYAIQGGALVVLETTPAAAMPNDSLATAPPAPAAQAESVSVGGSTGAATHVIRWRGADGTGYTLSGPVSEDVLQHVRTALGKGL